MAGTEMDGTNGAANDPRPAPLEQYHAAPVCARQSFDTHENIPASLAPLDRAPGWFSVEGLLPLEEIKTGSLYVADPSTRYSIDLLAPQPGEEILDACAAPGGKSAAIIAATRGKALLTATDLHEHRLPTLKENLDRQGSPFVRTAQADWSLPCRTEWKGRFDAVLLDVPCSNTGVIQRRVDVRWRLTPEESAAWPRSRRPSWKMPPTPSSRAADWFIPPVPLTRRKTGCWSGSFCRTIRNGR